MRRPNRIARDKGDLPHPNCAGFCIRRDLIARDPTKAQGTGRSRAEATISRRAGGQPSLALFLCSCLDMRKMAEKHSVTFSTAVQQFYSLEEQRNRFQARVDAGFRFNVQIRHLDVKVYGNAALVTGYSVKGNTVDQRTSVQARRPMEAGSSP